MDVLDKLREIEPAPGEPAVDTTAARTALHRAVAAAERRERRGALGWVFGGAVAVAAGATAVIITVSLGNAAPVAPVAAPTRALASASSSAAVAADVLLQTALKIESEEWAIPAGSFLQTDVILDQVLAVTPPGALEEVSYVRTGAEAALVVRWTNSSYESSDNSVGRILAMSDLEGIGTYGDADLALRTWANRYEGPYGPYGSTPAVHVWQDAPGSFGTGMIGAIPSPGNFDPDPQGFLDQWERSGGSGFVFSDARTVAADMMTVLIRNEMFYTAPADYRAAFLRALALAPDVALVATDGDVATLELADDYGLMRVVIDTAAGRILRGEEFPQLVVGDEGAATPAGDSPVIPDDVPSFAIEVRQQIVDETPALTEGTDAG